MLERFFGPTITLSTGRVVPVRLIGEQHVREDLGFIPSFADWVRCIRPEPWMGRAQPIHRNVDPSPAARKTSAPAPSLKEGQAMPRIVETTVFRLDELSERARGQARAWYREAAACDDWHECVFEDFETICAILGVRLKTRSVRLYGGGTRQKPCIWFSGFSSQGDGASFESAYSFATGAPKAIRAHAPEDSELHRIADALQAIQRRNSISSAPTSVSAGVAAMNTACRLWSSGTVQTISQ